MNQGVQINLTPQTQAKLDGLTRETGRSMETKARRVPPTLASDLLARARPFEPDSPRSTTRAAVAATAAACTRAATGV
jgi:hypothetical protein